MGAELNPQQLTAIAFENGVWEGFVEGPARPDVEVRYLDEAVEDVEISQQDGGWLLRIPVPVRAVSEGVHCFVICDTRSGGKLGAFTLIAGEPAADDLRAEVELLRAELDMLKRAFQRHCLENGQ